MIAKAHTPVRPATFSGVGMLALMQARCSRTRRAALGPASLELPESRSFSRMSLTFHARRDELICHLRRSRVIETRRDVTCV